MADRVDAAVSNGARVLGATLQQLLAHEVGIGLRVPFWIRFACKALLAKGTLIDFLFSVGLFEVFPSLDHHR